SLGLSRRAQPEYMHDRYMYFSLPGVALVVVLALKGLAERVRLPVSRSFCAGATLILSVVLALSAWAAGYDWGSEISTFMRSASKQPGSTWSQGYLGNALGVAANGTEEKDRDRARVLRGAAAMHMRL